MMLLPLQLALIVVIVCISIHTANVDGLVGTYERKDVEYVFQKPQLEVPVAMLFVAHGCSHSSTDWWPASSSCPNCSGLPVEMSIVREALRRGMLVLAVSSYNRVHKCWTNRDVEEVSKIINHIYETKLSSNYDIPLYLLGASSGGAFVGYLSTSKKLRPQTSAICVQISSTRDEHITAPVLFVLMQRDQYTLEAVQESKKKQLFSGPNEILVCPAKPITPLYFKVHGAVRTEQQSVAIQQALLIGGYLDSQTLLLKQDPRGSDWREVR